MKILLIGGTTFLGRHLVAEALLRNHEVTLFNRGGTNPDLFPAVEKIRGDREHDIGMAADQDWDVVIDTCGYLPRILKTSCRALKERTGLYVFISSVSVYADFAVPKLKENAEKGQLAEANSENVKAHYGPLKALCEAVVKESFPERSLIVRPGIIVGPHDPTDRFTYWVRRIAESRQVLVPDRDGADFQYIYAVDLARWIIAQAEERRNGVYNTTTPPGDLNWGCFLQACVETLNPDCQLVRANDTFLLENGISDWSQFPLWIPESRTEFKGFYAIDSNEAMQTGLKHSPLSDVISKTSAWVKLLGPSYGPKVGLEAARESELIVKHSL